MKKIFSLLLVIGLLTGCDKDDDSREDMQDIVNRLNFIIDDNRVNFSIFNAGLTRTPYRVSLAEPGPFTVLLPDNNAFTAAGYANDNAILTESATILNSMIPYHITHGRWELNKLPFKFNQEIESITGAKLYITRWVKNGDTVTTINGTRVLSYNLAASNGLIQVLNTVLLPLVHTNLSEAIASDNNLTYLNVALQRAGMKNMLADASNAYTIFAPNNAAFIAAGYADINAINTADPAVLRRILEYTLFSGRKFIYDYILTTDATDKSEQKMYTGSNIAISLVKSGVNYTGITIKGIGNPGTGTIVKPNVLAGNGVLHITSLVLKENL